MAVATDDVFDVVLQCQFVERKIARAELEHGNPVGFVEEDEFGILIFVGFQVTGEELELLRRQVSGSRIVQHREVRVLVVEAVLQGAAGSLLVELPRGVGKNVVIAGGEVERVVVVTLKEGAQLKPLGLGDRIVTALDRVAYIDDEVRM